MCLLISQPAGTVWSRELIEDFYGHNRDGIGVMWAQGGDLQYEKALPTSAADAVAFIEAHVNGKECAVHFRMRTHGDIDHDNCHPYEVFGFEEPHEMPLLLMHNGVLHTGNSTDDTKSDTYHYVRDYLRPMLDRKPELAFTPEFADVIGKHIGNNRFVLMNHDGQTAVINRSQGVEYNGAWLSNTYAWNAYKYLPRRESVFGDWGVTRSESVFGDWGVTRSTYKPTSPSKGSRKAGTQAPTGNRPQAFKLYGPEPAKVDPILAADVSEVRDTLDTFHQDNTITDKQIERFLINTNAQTVYFALELLMDLKITPQTIDTLFTSEREQRDFAAMKYSDFYSHKEATKEYLV